MQLLAVILAVVPFFALALVPPGGIQPAQLSEEETIDLIKISEQAINDLPTSAFVYVHVGDANITVQVVKGILYTVDLDVAETDCPKGSVGKDCHIKKPEIIKHCRVRIYEQSWIPKRQVTVQECYPK